MSRTTIIAVDDDRAVLASVDRDLRQKYGRDYRIVKAESGAAALELVNELKRRNEAIALFVVDQRMPRMTGVEFLEQVNGIFPDARKVLLTAYADTDAAISAINDIDLDFYLMKPWDPPDEHLYPVLDGLLDDWRANVKLPFEGIRVVGAMWSSASHEIKDFLARSSLPYLWLDVERDEEAQRLMATLAGDALKIPLLQFPDGEVLIQPTTLEVAEKAGLRTKAENPF